MTLSQVAVSDGELLAGDGYDTVLKPFRTIEDAHVLAAAMAWGVGVGIASGWERAWVERAVAVIASLRAIGACPPSAAETHVALAGALGLARKLLEEAPWDRAPATTRDLWQRDRAVLDVASPVRAARADAAWRHFSP